MGAQRWEQTLRWLRSLHSNSTNTSQIRVVWGDEDDSKQLCYFCRAIDLPALFVWKRDEPEWDLDRLFAQKSCRFCLFLKRVVAEDHDAEEINQFLHQKAVLKLARCGLWENEFNAGVVGRCAVLRSSLPLKKLGRALSFSLSPEEGLCILPFGPGNTRFGYQPKNETDRMDVGTIKTWIQTCRDNHGPQCNSSLERKVLPQFLIDVKKNCIVQVSCIPQWNFCYVTLSYVWGRGTQPLLTNSRIPKWKKRGSLATINLPNTISDAMTMTVDIGQRYLWVDCLCIVQDDAAQLHRQIQGMHSIYHHSVLTIIAAAGAGSSFGLPGVRNSRVKRNPNPATSIGDLQLATLQIKPHAEQRKSAWNSRGWTFQEELCASRRLVLTKSGAVFNCAEATWREEFPHQRATNRERYFYSMYPNFGVSSAQREAEKEDVLFWYSVVLQNYLVRHLSNPEDILNGFAGVASFVSSVVGSGFWGLPEKYFHQAICWSAEGMPPKKRRKKFPTWSWAGWHHPSYPPESKILKLFPRENGVSLEPIVQFCPLSRPSERWPITVGHERDQFHPTLSAEMMREHAAKLSPRWRGTGYLLLFFTSAALLKIERREHQALHSDVIEYSVINPQNQQLLTTIALSSDTRIDTEMKELIVVGNMPGKHGLFGDVDTEVQDQGQNVDVNTTASEAPLNSGSTLEESFFLMMIEWVDGVALREGLTQKVPVSRWDQVQSQRKLITLG